MNKLDYLRTQYCDSKTAFCTYVCEVCLGHIVPDAKLLDKHLKKLVHDYTALKSYIKLIMGE